MEAQLVLMSESVPSYLQGDDEGRQRQYSRQVHSVQSEFYHLKHTSLQPTPHVLCQSNGPIPRRRVTTVRFILKIIVVHYKGGGHVAYRQGIPARLRLLDDQWRGYLHPKLGRRRSPAWKHINGYFSLFSSARSPASQRRLKS